MDATEFPHAVSSKITEATHLQMVEAKTRFGVTPGALVRMALEGFMPGYLAAQGRTEDIEFFAQLGAALKKNPGLRAEIEKLTRSSVRQHRSAA